MDLARAFTKRSKRPEVSVLPPTRAGTIKHNGPIRRSTISPPIELLSTTNVLAYDAPDIYSSPSSAGSVGDDSDGSLASLQSSRGTTPDNSLSESCLSPVEPNHLSCYFQSPGQTSATGFYCQPNGSNGVEVPSIPKRALSHTKKSHQAIARQRSLSRSHQPPNAIHDGPITRSSIDMFSNKPDVGHPFCAELDQVNELVEEIGSRQMVVDEEEQYLLSHGLLKFGVEDYMDEIEGLIGGIFGNPSSPLSSGWI